MTSYGAIDTQPHNAGQAASDAAAANLESNAGQIPASHSFQELDMRFLKEEKTSSSDRRRKMVSTLFPILVAFVIVLLFAKVALGAIAPAHDPKYPTEVGSRPVPTKASKITEAAPVAAPVAESSSSSESSSSGATASCSAYEACDKLGLTGLCCPTGDGITLGCCN